MELEVEREGGELRWEALVVTFGSWSAARRAAGRAELLGLKARVLVDGQR